MITAILAGARFWPARSADPVTAKAASASVPTPVTPPVQESPPPTEPAPLQTMKVEVDTKEPAWISVTDKAGARLAVGLVSPGRGRAFELDRPATLRTGNAGGLEVAAPDQLVLH